MRPKPDGQLELRDLKDRTDSKFERRLHLRPAPPAGGERERGRERALLGLIHNGGSRSAESAHASVCVRERAVLGINRNGGSRAATAHGLRRTPHHHTTVCFHTTHTSLLIIVRGTGCEARACSRVAQCKKRGTLKMPVSSLWRLLQLNFFATRWSLQKSAWMRKKKKLTQCYKGALLALVSQHATAAATAVTTAENK